MAHPLPLPPVLVLYQFTVMFRHAADEIMKQASNSRVPGTAIVKFAAFICPHLPLTTLVVCVRYAAAAPPPRCLPFLDRALYMMLGDFVGTSDQQYGPIVPFAFRFIHSCLPYSSALSFRPYLTRQPCRASSGCHSCICGQPRGYINSPRARRSRREFRSRDLFSAQKHRIRRCRRFKNRARNQLRGYAQVSRLNAMCC